MEEILERITLRYKGVNNYVVLFKCHWFDIDNGVRVDRVHGLVEVKHNSSFKKYDSFVLAWQVTSQVYYLPYISLRRGRPTRLVGCYENKASV
jgi:Domain of unknown function (DUF4216)